MSGAMSAFPQYAFIAWCSVKRSTGTSLPLPFHYHINSVIRFASIGFYLQPMSIKSMDKIHKHNSINTVTPSSESYRTGGACKITKDALWKCVYSKFEYKFSHLLISTVSKYLNFGKLQSY
jgi:hypothetical protein